MASVTIRRKKANQEGKQYLFLDINFKNGRPRKKPSLNIWLWANDGKLTADKKRFNRSQYNRAQKEQLKTQVAINEGLYEIEQSNKKILLKDLFNEVQEKRGADNLRTYQSYVSTWRHIERHLIESNHPSYTNITLEEVNTNFVEAFQLYLKSAKSLRKNSTIQLSTQTQNTYWIRFAVVMNDAYLKSYIVKTPFINKDGKRLTAPKFKRKKQKYLTKEELMKLKETTCQNETLKNAFLFACCTGLRKSDIETLRWCHIVERNGKTYLIKNLVKGNKEHKILINEEYLKYLGDRRDYDKLVFIGLRYDGHTNNQLRLWCAEAGIKDFQLIHSHTARHTFATQMLSADVPIYTVSQLLAHKEVSTTQREYAQYIPSDGDEWLEKVKFV